MHITKSTVLICGLVALSASAAPVPAAENIIQSGIKTNIDIQHQYKDTLKGIKTAETKTPGSPTFKVEQNELKQEIKDGKGVRLENQHLQQQLQPNNKPLKEGLATIQKAQGVELKQVKSLDGNYKNDQNTIKTLNKEFSHGINVNKINYQLAGKGGH